MRVVEAGVDRIRRQRRGVVLVQLQQRRGEGAAVGMARRPGVGFVLVAAREPGEQRRDERAEHRRHEHQQDQRDRVVRPAEAGPHAQAGVEPRLRSEIAERSEEQQRGDQHGGNAPGDVAELEVAELVRQHRFHFLGCETGQQGVEEDDPARRAEAGEVGVSVRRAAAAVHHEQALGGEAGARHQGADAGFERRVGERLETIEERRDQGRHEHQRDQVECRPRGPGPEPPERPARGHDPEHECDQRQADDDREQQALDRIGEPEPPGHPVEAEPRLDAEGGVEIERQVEQTFDGNHGGEQRQLVREPAPARRDAVDQQAVEQVEPAEQGPAEQGDGTERHLPLAVPDLGERVVGGLVMRSQVDGRLKRRRHGVAMTCHMPHLPAREPRAQAERGDQRGSENERPVPGIHRRKCRRAAVGPLTIRR